MSYNINDLFVARNSRSGYQIEQSLRFNQEDSTYLNWTPSTAGSVKKWTWSGWVKRGKGGIFGQGGDYHPASIVANNGSIYNLPVYFGYNTEADQSLFYYGNTPLQSKTSQVFRDFSGWYHFVAFIDTDQATAANRQKLYVNGVEVTSWATQNLPAQGDSAGVINTTSVHRIGWTGSPGQQYFDGYMAECHFIDGQALDPENFGEFDGNGVWRPIAYTGSHGTNGFYLTFDPSAANGIGHDHSGNGNNWTPSGFTTAPNGFYVKDLSTVSGTIYNPTNAFDGSLSTGTSSENFIGEVMTWTPSGGKAYTSSVEIYGGEVAYDQVRINGGSYTSMPGSSWKTIATGSGTITTIDIRDSRGTAGATFNAIRIDGVILVDYAFNSLYDVLSDTPTNNFATLIPINPNYGRQTTTPVDGNLKATFYPVVSPSHNPGAPALTTFKIPTTGKWYYEFTVSGSNNYSWGVAARNDGQELYNFTLSNRAFWGWYHIYQPGYPSNGNGSQIYSPGTGSASGGGSLSSGDVIGMAINFDNNSLTITRNGSSYATITSCNFSSFDYVLPQWGTATNGISGSAILLNAGQRAFEYTVPTDHQSLCTANLPEPTIKDGGKYFNTVLYTGNANSTQAITGVGFSPDFVWIKNRGTGGTDHLLFDAVRGVTKVLKTVGTGAEETDANAFQSFDSDGFTLGTSTSGNPTKANGSTYVAWGWDAGGSGSSNTDGSITSTVSANPSAGFSIVTYTGGGSNGTVGHGLNDAPKCVIVKNRSSSTAYNWYVWHAGLTSASYFMNLNRTDNGETFSNDPFGGTAPTSTVFTVGGENRVSSVNYVAYCFSEVAGYSRMGTYVANSNSDGPFVYCGFKPAWLMVRSRSSGSNWNIYDNKRQAAYNPTQSGLNAGGTNIDGNLYNFDFLSNGFKLRTSDSQTNYNGWTYIFMAFAEHSFGGDGVSPATAR